MLCDRCQEREANVGWTSIIGGQTSQMTLCQECFKTHYPKEFALAQAKLEAGCSYCGTKCGASICQDCLAELKKVMESKGFKLGELPSPGQEIDRALTWLEIMAHMRKWVSEGKPDSSGGPFLAN
jgi:hypothetical protein